MPDFLIRLKTNPVSHLILETMGYDPLEEVKDQVKNSDKVGQPNGTGPCRCRPLETGHFDAPVGPHQPDFDGR